MKRLRLSVGLIKQLTSILCVNGNRACWIRDIISILRLKENFS